MNKQNQIDDGVLREFLNPEKIEKAPEGFTSKTMTRIQIECQSALERKGFLSRYRIPMVSAAIISMLVIFAIILPAETAGSVIWNNFQSIKLNLPTFSNLYLPQLKIPVWALYAIIMLFLLAFFDRAIFRIFRKD